MIKSLIKLIVISSVFYAVLFWYFDFWHISIQCSDAISYQEAARLIYFENFKPHVSRPFGYPLILGFPLLFDASERFQKIYFHSIHFIFWLSTVLLLYRFLLKTMPQYAFLGSLLFVFNIGTIALSSQTLTETFFTFICFAAFYFWWSYWGTQKHCWLLLSFLLFCLGITIKPIGLYFLIPFLGFTVFTFLKKDLILYLLGSLLFVFSTVGFQIYQMKKHFNILNMSTIQDFALYYYIGAYSEVIDLPNRQVRAKAWKEICNQRKTALDKIVIAEGIQKGCNFAREQFMKQFREHPINVFKTFCRNIFSNSIGYSGFFENSEGYVNRPFYQNSVFLTKVITSFQNSFYSLNILLIIPFSIIRRYFKEKCYKIGWNWLGGWLFCIYIIFSSGISFAQGDRLHIMIVPMAIACLASLYSAKTNTGFGTE